MQNHYAEYGNTRIPRGYCSRCRGYAFVIDQVLQCCDRNTHFESQKVKKMSASAPFRKRPPSAEKILILEKQQNQCLYCGKEFGSIAFRKGKPFLLRLEWDHQIPFAYAQDNKTSNFCAACHICNRIKGALMFKTVEEAIVFIRNVRIKKEYSA